MKNYLLLIFLICSTFISAQNFTVDGINYTVTTATNVSVTTTCISGSVTIPATVTYDSTLYTVTNIGPYVFKDCTALTSVTISNGITHIESGAFQGCTNLSSVTLPSNMTDIGSFAFRDCSNLSTITLPEGISIVRSYSFYGCTSLTSVSISSTVTVIDANVFRNNALVNVTLPEGLTSIGAHAFRECSSLENVVIPSTITSMGNRSFQDCTALTSVTVGMTTPLVINANVFTSAPLASATLYVPSGTVSNYEAASVWTGFNTITESSVLGLEALDSIKNQWVVYINQSESILEIKPLNNGILQEVNVFSMDGKNVLTSTGKRIDLSFMKSGLYVVKTTTNQGVFSAKIIKE